MNCLPASIAHLNSSSADIVSTHNISTPPSTKPLICSENPLTASSSDNSPRGVINSPDGPIDPAIIISRLNPAAAFFAISAAL